MLAILDGRLTDIEIIIALEALCIFLACALLLAIALAFFAIIEMRRTRLALARKDPLWEGLDDEASPWGGAIVARLRRAGGA